MEREQFSRGVLQSRISVQGTLPATVCGLNEQFVGADKHGNATKEVPTRGCRQTAAAEERRG
jgi:hypothetical protein